MFTSALLLSSLLAVPHRASAASLPRVPRQEPAGEPTCSGKELGSTFVYSGTSGSAFDVLCGEDYLGGDLRTVSTASFKDCLDACEADSSCVTVAYRDGACYLKNKLTPAISNEFVWSAKKQVIPTSTALSCENKLSDGTTYTASKGSFKIICGKEYPGGDLSSLSTSTFEGCIEACATNAQCIDVSFVDGTCYLKHTLTALTDVGYVWTAQLIDPPPAVSSPSAGPTAPAALTCIDDVDNGKSYTAKTGGRVFTVECGIDHAGGDLKTVEATTFETCMDECAATDGCIDVSWVYGTCYLKDTLNAGVVLSHVWTGRLAEGQASSASTTPSPTPSPLPSSSVELSTLSSVASPTPSATPSETPSNTPLETPSSTPSETPSSSIVSSTPVDTSSSIVSTPTPEPTSSSISTIPIVQTPSSTSSAEPPASTEFCLKVVTPGLVITNKYVTSPNVIANFVFGFSLPPLIFKLDESNRLRTASDNFVSRVGNSQSVNPRQFTPAVVAASPAQYPPLVCTIGADQTLSCTTTSTTFTHRYWTSQTNTDRVALQMLTTPTSDSPTRVFYSLGIVPKELCPAAG